MPHRTTPPLTATERSRRYRAKHPEKKEEFRLKMRERRAAERQKQLAERLALQLPTEDEEFEALKKSPVFRKLTGRIDPGLAQECIPKMAEPAIPVQTKIDTGLAHDGCSRASASNIDPTQGSKV